MPGSCSFAILLLLPVFPFCPPLVAYWWSSLYFLTAALQLLTIFLFLLLLLFAFRRNWQEGTFLHKKNPLKWASVYILQLIQLRGGKGVDKSKTTSYRPKSANLTKRAVHLGNIEHIFSMTEPWCENQRRVYETPQLLPSPPERSETEGKEEKTRRGDRIISCCWKTKEKDGWRGLSTWWREKKNAGWGWETKWWWQHNLWKFLTFPLCSRYT